MVIGEITPFRSSTTSTISVEALTDDVPAIRTDGVYAVYTSIEDTLAAVAVADALAQAMSVPLTLVHFRNVPYQLPIDAPDGSSPIEAEAFVARLRGAGFRLRARVYLCRQRRRTISMAFKRRSLIVIGGRHRWWPTPADRWRRWLESAGHFVVFVAASRRALHA